MLKPQRRPLAPPNTLGLLGANRELVNAICSVGRQLANRVDQLIRLQSRRYITVTGPDGETIIQPEAAPGDDTADLLRLVLANYPANHILVTVGTALTPLAENVSPDPVVVMLTNNDAAQILRYGGPTMTQATGLIIQTERSEPVRLPPNSVLYGMVAVATIQVGVSRLILPRFGV